MKTKHILALIVCSVMSSAPVYAMGSKKPNAPTIPAPTPPTTTPTPTPTPPVTNIPTLDFGPALTSEDYLDVSAQAGPVVDDIKNDDELSGKSRSMVNADNIDKCFSDENSHEYFADQISYYANHMMDDVPAKVGFIGSSYGTSSDDSKYFPTSLIRHPLCESTTANLKATMKNIPNQATIDKLNLFADTVNSLRQEVLSGDMSAKKELLGTWSKFFSCLSYSESLGTADLAKSNQVAAKVAPAGYRKPAGVKFYEDAAQPAASRLNIGMFQFTPDAGGNVQPCIRAWNELHKSKASCQVNQKASQSELIKIFGSSLQSFNAFCGVHKLIQTFAIQVNSTKTSATHPANLVNGKLKPSEQRCVTPYFYRGWAYNHFGPFQNSTGSNMNELITCTLNSR